MRPLWLHDLESLEAISQDEDARRIFLRMAALSQTGRMPSFLVQVALDRDLDDVTKDQLSSSPRTSRSCWRSRSTSSARTACTNEGSWCRDRPARARHPRERKAQRERKTWAILDSNQGPPPYQSGALTS